MKKILKNICLFCLFFILTFSMVGCSGNSSNNQPDKITVEAGLTQALKDEGFIFDKISSIQINTVDINDSDFEQLKSKYASQVPYVKYEATYSLITTAKDTHGNYSMIFVYNNGAWELSFGYITDKNSFEYEWKETVSLKRVKNDIKNVSIGNFEKGYVGDDKYSTCEIVERITEKNINRDEVRLKCTAITDFAEYVMPVSVIYYFTDGDWVLSDIVVSDESEWKLIYDKGREPKFMSESEVISKITTSTEFLTYVCNKNYVSDYSIVKGDDIADRDSVKAQYIFTAEYKNLGKIEYYVAVLYEWLDGEWGEGEMSIELKNADFSDLINTQWNGELGDKFLFTEVVPDEENVSIYTFKGIYTSNENQTTDIIVTLTLPLRDNNWEAVITDKDGRAIWDMASSSLTLDTEYKAIKYDGNYYAPTKVVINEETGEIEEAINTSNVLDYVYKENEAVEYNNVITENNIELSEIVLGFTEGKFAIESKIVNLAEVDKIYNINVMLLNEDDDIVTDFVITTEEALEAGYSTYIEEAFEISEEIDLAQIVKIKIYIR